MFKLDWNENADPDLIRLVGDVLQAIPPEAASVYPNLPPLYQKLAGHLGVDRDRIALAAGSEGAIRQIFEAFVDPGDVVAISQPSFGMYEVYVHMFGATLAPLPYEKTVAGPVLSAGKVIATIQKQRPKLVFLPNPDSPTGTVFNEEDLRTIIEVTGESGGLITIDEAYFPFYEETVLPWTTEYEHLIVLRTTSKAWAMAGLRIGYAVSAPTIIEAIQKVRPMFEVNSIAVEVFLRMLDHYEDVLAAVQRLNAGKEYFCAEMGRLNFMTFPCAGNFQHVAFGESAEKVHAALASIVSYRTDSDMPGLEGFSRFSTTTVEQFKPIVAAIKQAVGSSAEEVAK
ncbi:MAG: aminotransferase class I/II-fold pyridoxal phosphate-dependent enzyme [Proteobacteria bacterium]|nr:aminotransferase class I/II-fold pyridoxal phosphate-dependent enzyme [Pseudomonadota bacterium]